MKNTRTVNATEAIKVVKPGARVFLHSAASAPQALIDALVERSPRLSDIHLYHIHTEGQAFYARKMYSDVFHDYSFFIGDNVRKAIQENRADYIPVMLSELGGLFHQKIIPLDVALFNVSKPDANGFVSLGVSVDVSLAALRSAKTVVGQVNKYVPYTYGDGLVHLSEFDFLVEQDDFLPEVDYPEPGPAELAVGAKIAELIPDGATLQMGIGALPNAVLRSLVHHKHLGVHSEMFSDGLIPLLQSGAVDNSRKVLLPGITTASFLIGSKKLYDFVDENPSVALKETAWVNDPFHIAQNPNVAAVNSAIEVDLTGQVCADSIGKRMYSGVGGQADFMLGAARSKGGIPIIAMTSRTKTGVSKISPVLREGAGVTVTRAHMHWVVTEFGAVNLYGKSLRERAALLISIAHPDDRELLERAARERWG